MSKELSVTNLYGIRGTITHRTDSNVLVVTGDNGAGKSSFVDAFGHIFAHKAIKNAPDPVHEGQLEAEASFTDDDGIVYTRRWKNGKIQALEIRADDGVKYGSPGELLAEKLGTITVDVSQFLAVDEKARRDLILSKSTFPEGFDLDKLSHAQAAAEAKRTDANREVKRLEGALKSMTPPGKGVPDEEQSAADLIGRISAAETQARHISDQREMLARIEAEVADLEKKLDLARSALKAQAEVVDDLEDHEDMTVLREQLDTVESTNVAVREKLQHTKAKADHDAAVAVAKKAAQAVVDAKTARFNALQDAVFPHPALSVDDEYVLVDEVAWPYVNSGAKSLVALGTAIAGEHDDDALRLVILKEGDWLDANTLKQASEMLAEKGFFGLIDRGRPDMPEGVGIDVLEVVDGQAA